MDARGPESNGGQGPYPFSVANATSLLTSHGWKNVGGVMTCETAAACGAGVTAGTKLSITMDYATGVTYFQQEVSIMQVRHGAGRDPAEPGAAVVQHDHRRVRAVQADRRPRCKWQALNFGGWNFNGPGFEPTGEPLFQTGATSNAGSYSDPQRTG